jgi:hypothetical protein
MVCPGVKEERLLLLCEVVLRRENQQGEMVIYKLEAISKWKSKQLGA